MLVTWRNSIFCGLRRAKVAFGREADSIWKREIWRSEINSPCETHCSVIMTISVDTMTATYFELKKNSIKIKKTAKDQRSPYIDDLSLIDSQLLHDPLREIRLSLLQCHLLFMVFHNCKNWTKIYILLPRRRTWFIASRYNSIAIDNRNYSNQILQIILPLQTICLTCDILI